MDIKVINYNGVLMLATEGGEPIGKQTDLEIKSGLMDKLELNVKFLINASDIDLTEIPINLVGSK